MFKLTQRDGVIGFVSSPNDKSKTDVFWAKRPFKHGDDPTVDCGATPRKTVNGNDQPTALSIVDLEDESSSSEDDDDDCQSGEGEPRQTASRLAPGDGDTAIVTARTLMKQRATTLRRFGYQFMTPVPFDDDQSINCWNIVEAFGDDATTHGVSHVLDTSGEWISVAAAGANGERKFVTCSFGICQTALMIRGRTQRLSLSYNIVLCDQWHFLRHECHSFWELPYDMIR